MNEIYECCAGLDVHQRNIVACIMAGSGKQLKKETRTFSTATEDLRSLGGWLKNNSVCTVVMESTGIYWIPVFNILDIEMGLEVILANAGHVKNVPGRKTDAKDCEWLCKLLKNGLVKASFIPPAEIRDLRRLVRYRRDLIHDLSSANNRVIKNLESANIKLASVLTSVLCVTGKKIIAAILEGETNPEVLSEFVHGAVKSSKSDIRKALTGTLRKQDIIMLKFLMQNVENLEALIANVEQEISVHAEKYAHEIQLLDEIPGISDLAAKTIISEIGTDMSKFPNAEQFTSWVGVAPGSYESAGKKKVLELAKEIDI